jgi:hypothetical protein
LSWLIDGGVMSAPSGNAKVQLAAGLTRSRTTSCGRRSVTHPFRTEATVEPEATNAPTRAGPVVSVARTFPVAGSSLLSTPEQPVPELTQRSPATITTGPGAPELAGVGRSQTTAPVVTS